MGALLDFLQQKLEFSNPYGHPAVTGLYPCQVEWVEQYEQNKEMFWGLSGQIGASTIMAGICAWELMNNEKFVIATDNLRVLLMTKHILAKLEVPTTHKNTDMVVLPRTNSSLIRYRSPYMPFQTDLLILTPDSKPEQNYIHTTYRDFKPLARGKVIVASLPGTSGMRQFFSAWKRCNKPYLLVDCFKSGAIERLGIDWYEDMQQALSDEQFANELLCDFTGT